MRTYSFGLLVFLTVASSQAQTAVRTDQPITRSVKLDRAVYLRPAPGDERGKAALLIRGDNLTIDFAGATLAGSPETTEPNDRQGVGIEVQGRNVTIKNARVRGYKVGLIARNAPGLRILDSDFSYNWKQRLKSTQEKEDLEDWMSYHQNEKDEWLRYGAGIYLRDCDRFEVKNTRIRGGQNGLMLTNCNRGRVWNNDFSFLSSLGVGMYRSSDNLVMHNNIDWCVRGYSHGVYNRGQDSAGILVYEQSHRNTFAYNSVTHGGDGFFLWAGQTTMDTGKGGCNDNLLYGNDFSHAPTNGIEATFSRNDFVNNLLLECWHGVWGGYSYNTNIIGNVFGLNAQGIALEHGQDNRIAGNIFHRENEGIHLWQNPTQDPNWGYPKNRDTRSRDYQIENNLFSNTVTNVLRAKDTAGIKLGGNRFINNGKLFQIEPEPPQIDLGRTHLTEGVPLPATMKASGNPILETEGDLDSYLARFDVPWRPMPGSYTGGSSEISQWYAKSLAASRRFAPKPLRGGKVPFLKKGERRGRRFILVDEWGPYDFQRPILWPRGEVAVASSVSTTQPKPHVTGVQRYDVLGPKGTWRVVRLEGVEAVSPQSGSVPGTIDVIVPKGRAGQTVIELEYVGAATTDHRGITTPAGRPARFGTSNFFAPIDWNVTFFPWNEQTDPRKDPAAFKANAPLTSLKSDRLDFAGYGAFAKGVPAKQFATVADGEVDLPPGDYILEVTTDDGVRVRVDDKLVVDSWKYQGPTTYTAEIQGGRHRLHVEHFQIDGYATLKVRLRPKR